MREIRVLAADHDEVEARPQLCQSRDHRHAFPGIEVPGIADAGPARGGLLDRRARNALGTVMRDHDQRGSLRPLRDDIVAQQRGDGDDAQQARMAHDAAERVMRLRSQPRRADMQFHHAGQTEGERRQQQIRLADIDEIGAAPTRDQCRAPCE
ncbi:MAG: hypothetical protein M3Q15_01160 [Pseudomonadota bacterium]|nr:hypothetical protein [Pseudomonadota bacterium]